MKINVTDTGYGRVKPFKKLCNGSLLWRR